MANIQFGTQLPAGSRPYYPGVTSLPTQGFSPLPTTTSPFSSASAGSLYGAAMNQIGSTGIGYGGKIGSSGQPQATGPGGIPWETILGVGLGGLQAYLQNEQENKRLKMERERFGLEKDAQAEAKARRQAADPQREALTQALLQRLGLGGQ